VLTNGLASMPFDGSRVWTRLEELDLSTPMTVTEVFPLLSPERLVAAADTLHQAYTDFIQRISTPDMAISIRTGAFLRILCEQVQPASILDLGSGFSSFVLRSFAATCGATVWTVDDDPAWLERTRAFLTAGGLDDSNMWLWPSFSKQ